MIKWLGHATLTTASVVVRDTSNGVATLVCNGVTYTQTVNTAVKDGLVRFDVTGLSASTAYSYILSIPSGESVTGALKTQSNGIAKIGWNSCSSIQGDGAMWIAGEYDLDAMVSIGDEGYYEGIVDVDLASATDVTKYNEATLATRRATSQQYIMDKSPFYTVHDDHEYGCNDLRWSLAKFQTSYGLYVTDTTDMQNIMDAGAASTEHYSIGNPANNDAGIDAGAFYHRFDLGNHAEVFVLAAVCWGRDPTDATRLVRPDFGAANLMLGAKQNQWLRDRLKASTKKFKIIMSPKMTHYAEFTNADGWFSYFDELDDGAGNGLLPYIHSGTGWATPGGVIWCTGDYHTPSVHALFNGVAGAAYNHVEVCACPSQKDSDSGVRDSGDGGTYGVKFVTTGQSNSNTADPLIANDTYRHLRNFGVIEVQGDGSYMEAKIVLINGSEWWKGRVYAGENKLTYPAQNQGLS